MDRQTRHLMVAPAILFSVLLAEHTSAQTWEERASMSIARNGLAVAAIDGQVYASGGRSADGAFLTILEVYDPSTDTWQTKRPMNVARAGHALVALDRRLYAIGGAPYETHVEAYDPATDTWTSRASLPSGKYEFAAVAHGGTIYAFAAITAAGAYGDYRTLAYDPATDSWTEKATSPLRIVQMAGAVGDKIYVGGGDTETLFAYDPFADTFEPRAPMAVRRMSMPGSAVLNGRFYVAGGDSAAGNYTASVESYDPATDSWRSEPAMLIGRNGLGLAAVGSHLYAIGGGVPGGRSNANERFTPTDVSAPTLTVPDHLIVDATSALGAVVMFAVPAVDDIDPDPVTSCTPQSGSIFVVGTTFVSCTATDISGNMGIASFSVTVRGATEQTQALRAVVHALNVKLGIANSLDAKLTHIEAALNAEAAGDRPSACNVLSAFVGEVEAQSGKSLTAIESAELMTAAHRIRAVLGC